MSNPVSVVSDGSDQEPAHGWTPVTQTAAPLIAFPDKQGLAPGRISRGLLVRAPGPDDDEPNTAPVYVGARRVTGDRNIGTGGTPLPPGASITIPCRDPSKIFVVTASGATQYVSWIGV